MKRVVILSYHLYHQKRRGGMHWICDSLLNNGYKVSFITCDFSWITRLKGDRRTRYGKIVGLNCIESVSENLSVGVIYTPLHPIGNKNNLLGRMLNNITSIYPWPLKSCFVDLIKNSDLVVVESCGGLFLIDRLKSISDIPVIYRVSDNLSVIRPVPSLLDAERSAINSVDVVSVASKFLADYLNVGENLMIHPMGLDKSVFDLSYDNPYQGLNKIIVVISGSSSLDHDALVMAAQSHPDWLFFQFGSVVVKSELNNIIYKDEVNYSEMVRWVKYANIGFAPYKVTPGFEYQAEHSNRLLQYIYCQLPCVVPEQLCSPSKNYFIGYRSNDISSISDAFDKAVVFDREEIDKSAVHDWNQLALNLTHAIG